MLPVKMLTYFVILAVLPCLHFISARHIRRESAGFRNFHARFPSGKLGVRFSISVLLTFPQV